MVRVRVSVRVRVMDRVRVGLGIGIGIGLGTGVVKFSGSACHPSLDLSLQTKLVSFTNPFLHNHSYSFRTAFTDLNLYCIKGALALFVLVSFSWLRVLDKAEFSAFESMLLFYRIVSYLGRQVS